MRTYGNLPGFKYLYRTDSEDTVVLRLPSEGLLGLVGKKNEWIIRRDDQEGTSRSMGEVAVQTPLWALDKGIIDDIQNEVLRWQSPELYEAGFL